MASVGRFFGKFFGRTIGDAASFAIGGSISRTIDPALQEIENTSWAATVATGVTKPLEPGDAAEIVAEDVEKLGWGSGQAAQSGIGGEQFSALVGAVLNAPGVSELLTLWRRGLIDDGAFEHGLRKAKLETRWDTPLQGLKTQPLAPAVVAVAIQRGIIPDPGFLPVSPPTSGGTVPAFPVSKLSALDEAKAAGVDRDRLFVETAIVGNPASPDLAARMTFRGIIDETDYRRAISEGNTRNEWAAPLFEGFRQILTAHDGVEDHLRGWSTLEEMYAQTERHGMSREDTDVLFRINGRPLSAHQVFIGLRRGGVYDGPVTDLDPAFLKALQESNIRPEWYNLAWAQRYSYPAPFVLRKLATDGDISQAETEKILLYEGWEPALAKTVAAKWSGTTSTGAPAGPSKTATSSAVRAIGKTYVAAKSTKDHAQAELTKLGVPESEWPALFNAWDVTREANVKGLTNAQLRTAFRNGALDQATVLGRLEENGLGEADARVYLNLQA